MQARARLARFRDQPVSSRRLDLHGSKIHGRRLAPPQRARFPYQRRARERAPQYYQLIPSLQEYVLVSQSEARVERLASGTWEYSDVTAGTVQLSTRAVLDLAKLYDGLPD